VSLLDTMARVVVARRHMAYRELFMIEVRELLRRLLDGADEGCSANLPRCLLQRVCDADTRYALSTLPTSDRSNFAPM